ncbi:MAG: DUF4920 domain-containing protein [Candidatus Krumholzibacteriota bacterium]
MRNVSTILVSVLILLFAGAALAEDVEKTEDKVYGEGVTGEELILVSELMATPDEYIGKTVRVKGTAVGVCAHRGCWINIASDKEGETVRVKVKDGVIVFPPEIMGDTIIAEGVWTANELTMEQTKKVCEAKANEDGKEFKEDEVTTCMTLYQISGTGAVVVSE